MRQLPGPNRGPRHVGAASEHAGVSGRVDTASQHQTLMVGELREIYGHGGRWRRGASRQQLRKQLAVPLALLRGLLPCPILGLAPRSVLSLALLSDGLEPLRKSIAQRSQDGPRLRRPSGRGVGTLWRRGPCLDRRVA